MGIFRLARAAHRRASAWLERFRWLIVAAIAVWFIVLLVYKARTKSFWHDEVYTVLLARLTVAQLWRAEIDSADLSPPLNTMLTHATQLVGGEGPIVSRIPPMASLMAAVVLLFLTCRRRTGPIMALAAVFLVFATPAFDYAVEARGYGLAFACFALALSAWSEAAAGRRPRMHWTLMAVGLAAGLWTHYFAALAFLPIALGEATRQWTRRTFQPGPWIALAAAGASILPLWPLLAVAGARRETFWAKAEGQTVVEAYQFVLKDLPHRSWLLAIVGLLIVIEALRRWQTRRALRRLPAHELVACVACLLLPAAGLALGYATGAFTTRYLVFAIAGIAFAMPQLVWWLMSDVGIGDAVVAVALAWPIVTFTNVARHDHGGFRSQIEDHPWLLEWLKHDPVAVTGSTDYLGLWYSVPERWRSRAIHLADPESELRETGSDTVEGNYLALARWTNVPIARTEAFVQTHGEFFLYVYGPRWIEHRLESWHAVITPIVTDAGDNGTLYKVVIPASGRTRAPAPLK